VYRRVYVSSRVACLLDPKRARETTLISMSAASLAASLAASAAASTAAVSTSSCSTLHAAPSLSVQTLLDQHAPYIHDLKLRLSDLLSPLNTAIHASESTLCSNDRHNDNNDWWRIDDVFFLRYILSYKTAAAAEPAVRFALDWMRSHPDDVAAVATAAENDDFVVPDPYGVLKYQVIGLHKTTALGWPVLIVRGG
jgi:hypothetical protein